MDPARETYERLLAHYGPQGWWPARSRFEVIVGALLMPQTSWRNVATAIRNLREARLLDPRRLAAASLPEIRRHIRVAGLYGSKPARVRSLCRHLLAQADGDLDRYFARPAEEVRADLLAQPGVGPETADSILLYAGGHPAFVVDAYTVRIGRRLGLFSAHAYDAVQSFFTSRLSPHVDVFREYHALLVAHAKSVCRPTPRCPACPLLAGCAFGSGRKRYGGRAP
jgi:endonuclease-3 related protein